MPFLRQDHLGLTKRIDIRVAPSEKDRIRQIAKTAGMSVAELVRLRALG